VQWVGIKTQNSTVREAFENSAEGEPMNAVRDFLLPDLVLPPIVSILCYVQLDKSSLEKEFMIIRNKGNVPLQVDKLQKR
jgi:hypothetical protein